MREKKEAYKHILPHFQQPGQAYFVTWCLKDSVPSKALTRYTGQMDILRSQIIALSGGEIFNLRNETTRLKIAPPDPEIEKLRLQYYSTHKKYIKAYDDLLARNNDRTIDLNNPELSRIIVEALTFWDENRIENYARCIMPNHVHWVFKLNETDNKGNIVYLQDIMQSVKRQTANKINKVTGRNGKLWQKESFDTTIRDDKHLMNAIDYTLNNPVAAGFVKDWRNWPDNWVAEL